MFYRPSQSQSHRLLIIHQVSKKPEKILSLSQEATTEFKYPVIYDKPHLQVQNDRPGTPNVWYHYYWRFLGKALSSHTTQNNDMSKQNRVQMYDVFHIFEK